MDALRPDAKQQINGPLYTAASVSPSQLPRLPTRPVRPMRWTYSSMSLGRSKLMTCFTLEMSRPRAATCGTKRFETCTEIHRRFDKGKETYVQPWQPRWGTSLNGTGGALPLGLSGSGRRGYWCRRNLRGTGSPRERPLPSWSQRTPKSKSLYLADETKTINNGLQPRSMG